MRWSILSMLAVAFGLMVLAASQGNGLVQAGLREAGAGMARFLPVLAVAFLIMGFVQVLLPRELVERWLSESAGWRGIGAAWVAGALTPGGSIIGMPLAAGLLEAGVGPSVLVTYLTSLAVLSSIRVPLELGFYGWRLTSLRLAASLALPLVAGGTTRLLTTWFFGTTPLVR